MKKISLLLFVLCTAFELTIAQSNPLLIGVWGIKRGDNAKFEILADSIYYPDYLKSYNYILKNDSIIIKLDSYNLRVKYHVTNDSLFWYRKNRVTKFVRFIN
jgi:hypothetical protein